jgi:Spy/CpxP family protein refolding chaperone
MSKRVAFIVVSLVAGLGLTTLALAQATGPQGPRGPRDRGVRPGPERVQQELGITDAQMAELQKLKSDAMKSAIRRRADLAVARIDLETLLNADTVDQAAVAAKVKELGDLEAGALKDRVDARLAVRKVLSADQARKLERFMRGRHGAWGRDGQGRRGFGRARGSWDGPARQGNRGGWGFDRPQPDGPAGEPDGQ